MRTLPLLVAIAASLPAQQFVAELDPNPGAILNPSPSNAVAGNGVAYFAANSLGQGRELLVTDGTVAGTRIFADLRPGAEGSSPRPIGVVPAGVVVQVGLTVSITDGTPAGTRVLWTGVDSRNEFRWLGSVGGRFVWAHSAQLLNHWTLVGSDGTTAGTVQLGAVSRLLDARLRNGLLSILTNPGVTQIFTTDGLTLTPVATLPEVPRAGFAALGAYDYFLADDAVAGTELWRTDGTASGTSFVATLGTSQGISSIASLGAQLVLGAANQLWVSDGTGPGTSPLPVSVSLVRSLTPAGNALVFTSGSSLAGGPQLWRTDGTAPGTFVLDPNAATYSGFAVGATRTFCLQQVGGWSRLLRTDGTVAGTVSLPLAGSGSSLSLAMLGDEAIATMSLGTPTANTGLQAFRTDATTAGSLQLTNATVPAGILGVGRGAAIGSTLFFAAETAAYGSELWRTDGTPAGTQLVHDLEPGPSGRLDTVLAFGGAVWFASGNALRRHDGGPGTSVVALQPDVAASGLQLLLAKGAHLLFRTDGFVTGRRLWRSDGTPAGTVLLDTVGVWDLIPTVVQLGGSTFWVKVASSQVQLRRSDASPGGLVDFGSSTYWLGELGDRVLFVRRNGSQHQLFAATATSPVAQFVANVPFDPVASHAAGPLLVCIGSDGSAFATDGMATVTALPLPPVRLPHFAADGLVYLATADAATGTSLWRTDGTVAGTSLAITFGPGGLGSVVNAVPLGSGNRLFLNASDGVRGAEPWISAGTQATTEQFADLEPNGSSSPQLVGIAGGRAYFVAFDAVRGRELWSFELATVAAANAQPVGVGCPGTFGVPQLRTEGIPVVGRTLSLRIERGAPNSFGLWSVGFGLQQAPLGGGCVAMVSTVVLPPWGLTDAAGAAVTSLALPQAPALIGLQVVAQGACVDPLSASALGVTVTEGVVLVIGG